MFIAFVSLNLSNLSNWHFREWYMSSKIKDKTKRFFSSTFAPLLPSPWVIRALCYPPFVWPCRRGTDVLIHQNRTAPFTGRTPASKAAPPAGTNSCPPVLKTHPPRARADRQCSHRSLSGANSVDLGIYWERCVEKQRITPHHDVDPRELASFPIGHRFDTNLWEFERCNQLQH